MTGASGGGDQLEAGHAPPMRGATTQFTLCRSDEEAGCVTIDVKLSEMFLDKRLCLLLVFHAKCLRSKEK